MSYGEEFEYTVITGASHGLGKAFAQVCAKKGKNLILTSLPGENLAIIANTLMQSYPIKVLYHETDLTKTKHIYEFVEFLAPHQVNMLVNNAGIGGTTGFTDAPLSCIEKMLLLNMNSLVLLTHLLLPKLKTRKEAFVLNISSLAAFSPIPYKTVYSASKSFVYFFSRGLNEELKGTNVHLAVAHPGGMATNGEVSGSVNSLNRFLKLSILTPDEVAAICIEKLLNKEVIIVPGRLNKIGSFLQKIFPVEVQMKIYRSKFRKETKSSQ